MNCKLVAIAALFALTNAVQLNAQHPESCELEAVSFGLANVATTDGDGEEDNSAEYYGTFNMPKHTRELLDDLFTASKNQSHLITNYVDGKL